MRHILIIFSILLLGCVKNQTSTEFVQGTEFLYQYETSSGLIFKSFGDGKVQPKYKGEIKNGKPNGQGTITYPDGDKYVGKWRDGLKNGQGTYTWSDGDKYVGEWKDGEQNGQGTYIYHDGRKYEGEWKDGKIWNGTVYDKYGNIIDNYLKGVKQ